MAPSIPLPDNPISKTLNAALPVKGRAVNAPLSKVPAAPLPDNPVAKQITAPTLVGRPGHQYAAGAAQQLNAQTEAASAPALSSFEKASGGSNEIGLWNPADVKSIHEQAALHPDVAANIGGLVNPYEFVKGAVLGAKQLGHGVGEVAQGKLGHGALDIGLGGLSAASVLPIGKGAKALRGILEEEPALARLVGTGAGSIKDFNRAIPAEQADKNLTQFTNPKNLEKGGPQNAPWKSLHPEKGGHTVIGPITPEEHLARTSLAVGHDAGLANKLAFWYRELGPMFEHYFGSDAHPILRGFAVSQANASPSGGLQAVLRVRDALMRGEQIDPKSISTVVKSIEAAYKGQHVSEGMAAKLHDFADSLEGKTTRTWTGDHAEGGSPTAIDIHAQRDLGRVDPKILSTLRNYHGLPVAHLQLDVMKGNLKTLEGRALSKDFTLAQKTAAIQKARNDIRAFQKSDAAAIAEGRRSGIKLDNPQASATGNAYNHALREYQAITDHYNQEGAFGRRDWTPAEVQALGWSAIQRFHGTTPEDAIYAIDRNTHHINTDLGSGSVAQAKAEEDNIRRIVAEEGGIHRDIQYGYGGREGQIVPSVHIATISSPEQADRIAQRIANEYGQHEVWATRPGVVNSRAWGRSRFALEIEHQSFSTKAGVQRFAKALYDNATPQERAHLSSFTPYTYAGPNGETRYGLRFITGHGYLPEGSDQAMARLTKYNNGAISKAEQQLGINTELRHTNVEVRRLVGKDHAAALAGSPGAPTGDHPSPEGAAAGTGIGGRVRAFGHLLASEQGSLNLGAFLPGGRAARTDEEVTQHVQAAVEQAVHEGFGKLEVKRGAVQMKPGEVNPETGGDVGKAVRESISGPDTSGMGRYEKIGAKADYQNPKAAYAEKQALRSAESSRRLAAGQAAFEAAGGGIEGQAAKLEQLRGAYPQVTWRNQLVDASPETVADMINFVNDHPTLTPWEKVRVPIALQKMVAEKPLTPSDIRDLEKAFGHQTVGELRGALAGRTKKDIALDLANLPRTIVASTDLSSPFRQAAVATVSHPVMAARAFGAMFRAIPSTQFEEAVKQSIKDNPYFPLAEKGDVAFTGHRGVPLNVHEEARMSDIAEQIPIFGAMMRASNRGFYTYLNKLRMDYFARLAEQAARDGHDLTDPKLLHDLGSVVNWATGRGNAGEFVQKHLATFNALFFSPRLMQARLQTFNPAWYLRLSPPARAEALKSAIKFGGTVTAILALLKMRGLNVGTNPTSADFGKIKLGNTRIDIGGGYLPYLRLMAQLYTQKYTSSTTGITKKLGSGFGQTTDFDLIMRFLQGKLSPTAAIPVNLARGEDWQGNKLSLRHPVGELKSVAENDALPFMAQDILTLYKNSGTNGLYATPLDLFGIGVTAYKAKAPSGGSSGGWGSGGGSSSGGWGGSSGSTSSGGW